LTGKGSTFGKFGFGPFRWFFNDQKKQRKNDIDKNRHNEIERETYNLNSYQNTVIKSIKSDEKFLKNFRYHGLPWRGLQERIKKELPGDLMDLDKISYNLVPKTMEAIFGQQNTAWITEKRPSKSGAGFTTWIVIL